MTVQELMTLRGQIDMRLQYLVCGDPRVGVCITPKGVFTLDSDGELKAVLKDPTGG